MSINLLPWREQRQRKLACYYWCSLFCLAMIVLIGFSIANRQISRRHNVLSEKLASYQLKIHRNTVPKNFSANRLHNAEALHFLHVVAGLEPNALKLTQLQIENGKVVMRGNSNQKNTIYLFLKKTACKQMDSCGYVIVCELVAVRLLHFFYSV